MPKSDLDQKIEQAEKIYAEAMAKLAELQNIHQQILTAAKKRVEDEQMNKIRQSLT